MGLKVIMCIFFTFTLNVVLGQLSADFSFLTIGDSCGIRPMVFSADTGQGDITFYDWTFYNTTNEETTGTGSGQQVSRNFLQPGTYEVTLTVGNNDDTATKTAEIIVYDTPEVDFTTDVQEGCPPLDVTFTDQSLSGGGEITEWRWTYDDGTEEVYNAPEAPVHRYEDNGSYSPTLTVTNSIGCRSSSTLNDPIEIYGQEMPAFTVTDEKGCETPHIVTFDNITPETTALNFIWEFGDGTSQASNDLSVTHEYADAGVYRPSLVATNETGRCTTRVAAEDGQLVRVGEPFAGFQLPETVCAGTAVQFTPAPDPTGLSNRHRWVFSDGGTSNNRTPEHVFDTPGTYEVQYVNFNSASGCSSDTVVREVEVLPSPEADFSIDAPNACQVPHEVTFENQSNGAASYTWHFSNNTSETTESDDPVSHTYTSFGNRTVRLIARNDAGCSDEQRFNAVSIRPPDVNVQAGATIGCAPFRGSVVANVTSFDTVSQYIFDYGNGEVDTTSSNMAEFTYTASGTYTIEVRVLTASGCEASGESAPVTASPLCDLTGEEEVDGGDIGGAIRLSRETDCSDPYTLVLEDIIDNATLLHWEIEGDTVGAGQNPYTHTFPEEENQYKYVVSSVLMDAITGDTFRNQARIIIVDEEAAFTTDRESICKGMEIAFSTVGIDSSLISSYTWDFGDNTSDIITNPDRDRAGHTNHVYTDTGSVFPKLIIEDIFGCKDSVQYPEPLEVQQPEADFSVDTNQFCGTSADITFTDHSVANRNIPIKLWEWEMDEDVMLTHNDSTGVVHTYQHNNAYTTFHPSLTITDSLGCTDQYELNIHGYAPEADFVSEDTLRCDMTDISFTNNSRAHGDTVSYVWDFGDGTVVQGDTNRHSFPERGNYDITLAVTDENGCSDTLTQNDYINIVSPEAGFMVGDTNRCVPYSLSFQSTSTHTESYRWNFGYGNDRSTTDEQVSNFYDVAGLYEVRLIAVGYDGCTDTTFREVRIKGPYGTLDVEKQFLCVGEQVNAAVIGDNIMTYSWDFDGSTSESAQDTSHVSYHYTHTGVYDPNVVITGPEGCQVSLSLDDPVIVDRIHAGPDQHLDCGDTSVTLEGVSEMGYGEYFAWLGPDSVDYSPDSLSLEANVNVAGTYVLQSHDSLCTMTDTAVVTTSGIIPEIDAGPDQTMDCLSERATLQAVVQTPQTQVKWKGPQEAVFLPSDTVLQPEVDNAGEYRLIATNGSCTSHDSMMVLPCPLLPNDLIIDVCENGMASSSTYNGFDLTTLNDQVAESAGDVSWYTDASHDDPVLQPEDVTIAGERDFYSRIVSSDGAYVAHTSVSIVVHEPPSVTISASKDTICERQPPIQITSAVTDKNSTYQWFYEGEVVLTGRNDLVVGRPDASGEYVLEVNNNVCSPAYDTLNVKVYEQPDAYFSPAELHVTYGTDERAQLPLEVYLDHDTVSGVRWSPDEYIGYAAEVAGTMEGDVALQYDINDTMIYRPWYVVQQGVEEAQYNATIRTGPPGKGCEATVGIRIYHYDQLNIPNAFSPNNDGLNEVWVITGLEKYPDTEVTVFNRWGNVLFKDDSGYNKPWDGTITSGEKVPFGTYYYVIDLLGSPDDSDHSVSGWLLVTD